MITKMSILIFSFLFLVHLKVEAQDKPNIILIMADDLGFSDLGCYGSEIHTPNLDRLAKNGLRFTQFYNNAKCVPSRASLMTGLYPQQVAAAKTENRASIAQVLKSAGYRTLMVGKNGLYSFPPCERGFDRYYGLDSGCCNYFNPGLKRPGENEPGRKYANEQRPWLIDKRKIQPYTPKDRNFYATDAFTDSAIAYLNEYGEEEKPFFLYLSYTAPHFPLHALQEDIARYRGKYTVGWDIIRQKRYDRQVEMGLIDKKWELSPRDANVPAWDGVEDKDAWDLTMAVYAAMIDRMDQGIGRIMKKISELGVEENTLVLFLSDNGACAEDYSVWQTTAPEIPPGPMESYRTQQVSWANASNTPFRKFKWWAHEGGIATPFIAHWPKVIKDRGSITHEVGHIMDIMPTCMDIAGAESPATPLEGRSLLPIFQGKPRQGHEVLYWQFGGSCSVRKGKWKLVTPPPVPRTGIDHFSEGGWGDKEKVWELYNLETDRTELNNLADKYPDKVNEMVTLFDDWLAKDYSQ
jgi:arylsulfatase